jgi:predicted regulator of Ras-like GTPase activity (Roadblock/LC7/MglB family)
MAKVDALQRRIEGLRAEIPELRGIMLATSEGLPIAHSLSGGLDSSRVAAMAAAAASLARRVGENLSLGQAGEASIAGPQGMMFVYPAGPMAVLAVIGQSGTNAGLVHLEARMAAREMGDLFGGNSAREAA